MAFEGLSQKLNNVFGKLKGHGKLTEKDIKDAMREVRMALLDADVSFKVAKDFVNKVSEKALGAQVMESLTPAQMVIKIVNEELCNLMGGTQAKLTISDLLMQQVSAAQEQAFWRPPSAPRRRPTCSASRLYCAAAFAL